MTPAVTLSTTDSATAIATGTATVGGVAGIDGQPEGEEEDGGERVAQRQHQPLDPLARRAVSATTTPTMNAPIASDTPSSSATPATSTAKPDEGDRQQLVVGRPISSRPTQLTPRPGHRGEGEQEGERLPNCEDAPRRARSASPEHRLQQGEVQREEHVLDHDDAEDQPALRVGQPAQLDQQLGDDGRRRDADGAGDDECLPTRPSRARTRTPDRRRR